MKRDPSHRLSTAAGEPPFDWARGAGLGPGIAREARAEARRRNRRRGTIAAACGMLIVFALWQWPAKIVPMAANPAASRVKVLAPAQRTLADGSVVELKSGAAIEVDFSSAVRRVVLTSGEVHFAVAKDPRRPFVVAAHGIEVRAVGTAFAVEKSAAAVQVLVTEGQVAVTPTAAVPLANSAGMNVPAPPPATPVALLAAGNFTTIAAAGTRTPAVVPLAPDEMARRLAWRVPRLEFDAAPLAEVVRRFAEHGGVRLVLGDPTLRHVKVSGVLRADNVDALLQLLASDHGVAAENRGDEILLRRRR